MQGESSFKRSVRVRLTPDSSVVDAYQFSAEVAELQREGGPGSGHSSSPEGGEPEPGNYTIS